MASRCELHILVKRIVFGVEQSGGSVGRKPEIPLSFMAGRARVDQITFPRISWWTTGPQRVHATDTVIGCCSMAFVQRLSACFIPTDSGCRCRQPHAAFGLGNFVEDVLLLQRRHSALARLLPMTYRAAKLPGCFAQCTGHKQRGLGAVPLRMLGRCGGQRLAPPG